MKKKLTLKEAQKTGQIEKFIKQQKDTEPANKETFDKTISSISSGKKKPTQETCPQDSDENCNDTQTR